MIKHAEECNNTVLYSVNIRGKKFEIPKNENQSTYIVPSCNHKYIASIIDH